MTSVSVLINNYNYAKYISKAIESINYKEIEIVVYDDGSTDNSLDILSQYEIKVIANSNYGHTPNENQAHAIYEAFLQSTGDIICLLDSDDMFSEKKLQKIVEVSESDDEITTVQNLMLEIDREGELSQVIRPIIKEVDNIKSYIFEKQNFYHLFVPTSGLSFRRSFLEKVLPLQEDGLNYIWPDARLSLLSVFYGKIQTIMEPLTYYRIHGINDSNARGTLSGHSKYLEQIYLYFNNLAQLNGYPSIEFSKENYLENTYFSLCLNEQAINLFVANNSNVYIWGAGEAGQSICHFLNKNGCTVGGFVDANANRTDEKIMGLSVSMPSFTKGTKYIVSPIHAYKVIKQQLESNGFVENVDFIYPYKE